MEINQVKLDELQTQIQAISEAVKELKAVGLREEILLIAIQRSARRYHAAPNIALPKIKCILNGMLDLDKYLFPDQETI